MKAIYLIKYGDSQHAFEIRETQVPVAGSGEVVIRVRASGLNFADVMARRGLYKAAPPLPAILGYDIAGTVHEAGAGVTAFKPGQKVAAMCRFGGYAEYVKTSASAVLQMEEDDDPAEATALATQASTAVYSACFATRLYPGDRVLIHAAAGGVGSFLVQLAEARGCIIYGSASPQKHPLLEKAGVNYPINSLSDDPTGDLRRQLEGKKLDAVFDNIGGLSFKRGYELLGPGGRIIGYGAAAQNRESRSNRINTIRVGLGFGYYSPIGLLVRSQSMIGVNMLSISDHKPGILMEVMKEVCELRKQGVLTPGPCRVYPAKDIAEAHDYLESRRSIGKIALSW
jgi:NADPH2:quinone reductase